MRIIAVRHAKSDYPPGVADHDRPLSARGRRDATVAGEWLARQAPLVGADARVIVSTAARAQETWTVMRGALDGADAQPGWRDVRVLDEPRAYHAPARLLVDIAMTGEGSDVVIVAHNPGMQDLVLAARPSALRDRAFPRHRTCAIAVLEAESPDQLSAGAFDVVDYVVPRAGS